MAMQDLLLDTHIVIWLANDPDRVALRVIEAIENAGNRYVSHISALEVQLKYSKSPDLFAFSLTHLEQAMKEFAFMELPLTVRDIRLMGEMQFLHSDPFDRLLMAQAANRKIPLVSFDEKILRTAQRHAEFTVLN